MRYSAFEVRVFADASRALVASPIDARRVDRFLSDLAQRAPWTVAWGLKALLWLSWMAGSSRGNSVALWERALDHRRYFIRQLAWALKAMVCLCHFDER